jgi:hypothetical protein
MCASCLSVHGARPQYTGLAVMLTVCNIIPLTSTAPPNVHILFPATSTTPLPLPIARHPCPLFHLQLPSHYLCFSSPLASICAQQPLTSIPFTPPFPALPPPPPCPVLQLPLPTLLALHCQWLLAATPGQIKQCVAQYLQLQHAGAAGSSAEQLAALLVDWAHHSGSYLLAD